MGAEKKLLELYSEWRRLAVAEGKAIQTRNWELLGDCQLVIEDFQALVPRLATEVREEWNRDAGSHLEQEKQIRGCLGEIIDITLRNQSLLDNAQVVAHQNLKQLGEAGRKLKLVRSYRVEADSQLSCAS